MRKNTMNKTSIERQKHTNKSHFEADDKISCRDPDEKICIGMRFNKNRAWSMASAVKSVHLKLCQVVQHGVAEASTGLCWRS